MPPDPAAVKARSDPPHAAPAPHVGQLPITRGRHAGKKLCECPIDFIMWLAVESKCPTYRRAAAEFLGLGADEDDDDGPEPSRESAAVALPGIVWRWSEQMAMVHGDDHPVVIHGLAVLRAMCAEVTGRAFPPDAGGDHGA